MFNSFTYKKWDGSELHYSIVKNKVKPGPTDSTGTTFNFNDIKVQGAKLFLGKSQNSVSKKAFYTTCEAPNAIYISNLSEYIQFIDYYRFFSLYTYIKAIEKKYHSRLKTDIQERYDQLLKELGRLLESSIQATEIPDSMKNGSKVIDDFVLPKKDDFFVSYEPDENTDEFINEIKRAKTNYDYGGSFAFYRGVGHIYYPDVPSIFRSKYIHDEANWYRLMKTNYHDQLDELHYLDRLALLQHHDLPTRFLDVTINPLVALYMATNTIYTKDDPNQEDYAEIIVYFNEIENYKSYDSNSVLILAALAKLSYDEKEILKVFINSINEQIVSVCTNPNGQNNLRSLVNYCLQQSARHNDIDYVFTSSDTTRISAYINGIKNPHAIFKPSDLYNLFNNMTPAFSDVANAYSRLINTIRRENPAFAGFIDVFMLTKAFLVRAAMTNDRIRVQNGGFIIVGLDEDYVRREMASSRSPYCKRLIITDKKKIFRELNALAINDMTMFPDMSHQAKYLMSQVSD